MTTNPSRPAEPLILPQKISCVPSERVADPLVAEMSRVVCGNPLFQAVMESVDGYLMILSPQRQILAANRELLETLRLESIESLLGARPGEVLGCVHAEECPGGCGAASACSSCGAAISILTRQRAGQACVSECLATLRVDGVEQAREFRVRATPVSVEGREFTVLVFNDISAQKRREALERTFFHDILNTLGGLMGWCHLLQDVGVPKLQRVASRIVHLSLRLRDEIEEHRRLSDAESGTLSLNLDDVSVAHVLGSIRTLFEAHDIASGRQLLTEIVDPATTINTDFQLLLRVLDNMVKNALEAVPEGGTVRVWFEHDADGAPVFRVHNPGMIPDAVVPRVFQRSFSTRGDKGRGIGTYSMKLFGERYLGGQVGFTTDSFDGTVFYIRLPHSIF